MALVPAEACVSRSSLPVVGACYKGLCPHDRDSASLPERCIHAYAPILQSAGLPAAALDGVHPFDVHSSADPFPIGTQRDVAMVIAVHPPNECHVTGTRIAHRRAAGSASGAEGFPTPAGVHGVVDRWRRASGGCDACVS